MSGRTAEHPGGGRREYVLLGEERKAAHVMSASQRAGCTKAEPRNMARRLLAQRLSEEGSGAEMFRDLEIQMEIRI